MGWESDAVFIVQCVSYAMIGLINTELEAGHSHIVRLAGAVGLKSHAGKEA